MSSRNACCRCNNSRSSSSLGLDPCYPTPWYCRIVKPLALFIVSVMFAISAGHFWDDLSRGESFLIIKTDLDKLRRQLSTLTKEVENIMEFRNSIPKMTEAITRLRDEVSEGIEDLVRSELLKYDADKTGRTDYALEALGGSIVSTRDTERYTAGAPVLAILGIPLCRQQNTPQAVIQARVLPGECWAFKGTTGSIVIRLLDFVYVSGVSLEHISPSISPAGETTTAPRDFSVWGLRNVDDTDGFLFGQFTYDNRATPVQYFPVQSEPSEPYEIIELKIHSNSGNPEYTCVYRIRVHGKLCRTRQRLRYAR